MATAHVRAREREHTKYKYVYVVYETLMWIKLELMRLCFAHSQPSARSSRIEFIIKFDVNLCVYD